MDKTLPGVGTIDLGSLIKRLGNVLQPRQEGKHWEPKCPPDSGYRKCRQNQVWITQPGNARPMQKSREEIVDDSQLRIPNTDPDDAQNRHREDRRRIEQHTQSLAAKKRLFQGCCNE